MKAPLNAYEQDLKDSIDANAAAVAALVPLTNDGSPEGVVDAPLYSLCINTAGTTGTLLYIKILADIDDDTSSGWVAV
jgi:hypothetical protein